MYYVMKGGAQEGPFTEDELIASFAAGRFDASDLYWKEGMPDWQPLRQFVATAAPLPPAPTLYSQPRSVLAESKRLTPRAYLSSLRSQTCYGVLRLLVNLGCALSFVSLVISAVGVVLATHAAAGAEDQTANNGTLLTTLALSVGILLFGSVIIVAVRQAAFLLIDLVDAQLDANSRLL